MASAVNVLFLLWSLQNIVGLYCIAATTSERVPAELDPPHNVTMITLNTNYTLSWKWDQSQAVNFTTQYVRKYELKRKIPNWFTVCEEMSLRSCDLTALDLHHLGTYMLRVRANINGRHSDWVQLEFFPDKDAAVGPPANVDLAPAGSDLDVSISDPLTSTNSSMKDLLPYMYYNILYWERSAETQIQTLRSSANFVTLPHLKAWTWYCVSVQSSNDYYIKRSSFTQPQCMQTEGNTPWWQIFLCFLASLVFCFLLMLLLLYGPFWCYKTLKATLYPSNQLPTHFMEYLCDSPSSDVPRLLTPDSQSELLCDKVSVCPEPAVLEVHNPPPEALHQPSPGLEPDSSGRHNRQDSSSSGDSGVYSTGGSANLRQPNSSQTSTGTGDLWQGPFDLEQVKMQEMTPGLKTRLLTADKCIKDMCV
ncbi:interferon alpha/beta receptor 1b-like [Seriola dumerili]|uniref:Interferon alpha/beta receptor 1b-like n=1 Tax=Seriola dumerili TaxID=41447 RepID=A0A3B4T3H4_SERDU|nr:interferon alpha/beta receptor 1b-like [Seriola dumerili]